MPAKGQGAHGGAPHWSHGWKPVDAYARAIAGGRRPDVSSTLDRIRMAQTSKRTLPRTDLRAEIEANGGFTYSPRTRTLVRVGDIKGFAVAVGGTSEVVGEEKVGAEHYVRREDFIKAFARIASKHRAEIAKGALIGGWYSPEDNRYMVELTHVLPDRKSAIDAGRAGHQDAVFDLGTGETVFTRETVGRGKVKPAPLSTFVAEPSVAEMEAAKFYTGPGFKPLNGHLRFGKDLPPAARHYMAALDNLIGHSVTTQDVVTYRGVQSGSWLPSNLSPGHVITDLGYVSTAEDETSHYSGNVRMVIHVPKGVHALDLYAHGLTHHTNEREMLLPRGTRLRVVSDVSSQDGKRTITAEVMT